MTELISPYDENSAALPMDFGQEFVRHETGFLRLPEPIRSCCAFCNTSIIVNCIATAYEEALHGTICASDRLPYCPIEKKRYSHTLSGLLGAKIPNSTRSCRSKSPSENRRQRHHMIPIIGFEKQSGIPRIGHADYSYD